MARLAKDPGAGRVSIHASVKDATSGKFVPRSPWNVSIHASVKDATRQFTTVRMKQSTHPGFNPRVREGRDCGSLM